MTAITNQTMEETKPFKPGNKATYKWDIVWLNVILFAVLHALTIYAFYTLLSGQMKFLTFTWTFILTFFSGLGVTVGAHRLYTHKCFKANLGIQLVLLAAFTLASQNCLWVWVRDHRQHHKYSDTDADPHNATRGFFFSHIGWLMVKKQPEVFVGGKVINMSDLNADPLVMFQKKYFTILVIIFSFLFPTLVPCYFWNEDLWMAFVCCFVGRIVTLLNLTWLINSAAHMYGNKPFTKDILATENKFLSFMAIGEGWHNYHHSFPWDYRAAELGTHYNFSTTVIDMLAARGWVWDLKSAPLDMVRYRAMKRGDGTHPMFAGNTRDEPSRGMNINELTRDSKDTSGDSLPDADLEYEQLKIGAETKIDDEKFSKRMFA